MKAIFYADPTTHEFAHSDIVEDNYRLRTSETFENPTGKLEPAKLVGTSWQDATAEEHAAWVKQQEADFQRLHPNMAPAGPSSEQQMINALGKQQMTQGNQIDANTADLKQVKSAINFIAKRQMAQDNKATDQGGN